MKNPGVAFFVFTKSVTRWIRFASVCVIIAGRGFFAVLGVVVADLLAGRGGLALVSALSGQRKSKSSDAVLRFVSTGRFVGDTFVFTWPVAASEWVISKNNVNIRAAAVHQTRFLHVAAADEESFCTSRECWA